MLDHLQTPAELPERIAVPVELPAKPDAENVLEPADDEEAGRAVDNGNEGQLPATETAGKYSTVVSIV